MSLPMEMFGSLFLNEQFEKLSGRVIHRNEPYSVFAYRSVLRITADSVYRPIARFGILSTGPPSRPTGTVQSTKAGPPHACGGGGSGYGGGRQWHDARCGGCSLRCARGQGWPAAGRRCQRCVHLGTVKNTGIR